MAFPFVAKNLKVWMDAYDISGDLNAVALQLGSTLQEDTAFGDDTKSNASGLKSGSLSLEGYWQAGTDKIDEVLWGRVGLAGLVVTVGGETGAEGEVGWLMQPTLGSYAFGGMVGEMAKFTASAETNSHRPIVHSTILHNATRVGNGPGTGYNLGAVSATQRLFAGLHVLSLTGTSIAVKIQSGTTSGFGAPVDRITFATATQKGGQYAAPVAGAITDTWWRANWTLVGSSVTFVVVAGIL